MKGDLNSPEGKAKDRARDGYMKDISFKVLRFSDKEVFKNSQVVPKRIWGYL